MTELNNTTNDGTFDYKKASQILSSMIDETLIKTDKINDFTAGSATRTLFESEATELELFYYLTRENMNKAIDSSVLTSFGFEPKTATYAYGNVRIVFNTATSGNVYLPKGTLFTSSQSVYDQQYTTLDEYKIPKGTSSVLIPVYCTTTGTYGNIPANVIDTSSNLAGITSLTNPQAFLTGQDDESTTDMRIQFRKMIQALSRGTTQSLIYATESVPNIAGAYLYESTYGVVVVYCHDLNGDLSDDLQASVANALEDWRPAGIRIIVYPTHKSVVTANIGISVSNTGLEADEFLTIVQSKIESYINGFTAGQPIYKNDLIQKVMDINDLGIVDCSIDLSVTPDEEITQDGYIGDGTALNVKGVEVSQKYLTSPDITNDTTYGMVGVKSDSVENDEGNTYKDAPSTTTNGITTLSPIVITDKYKTNPNEILRAGTITVNLLTTTS